MKDELIECSEFEKTGASRRNVNNPERVASAVAGGALVAYGLKRGGMLGVTISALGGGLLLRGTTGHSVVYDAVGLNTNDLSATSLFGKTPKALTGTVRVKRAVTVNRSPADIYQYWRNFENLPTFMKHLESVTSVGENKTRWKAKAPLGATVEWDAELTSDIENQRIGWRSLEGADIPNSGTVELRPTRERGTEVIVTLMYEAPGGKVGEWAAWALGEEPSLQIADDLGRFKSLMETGLILTTEGQTSGRSEEARQLAHAAGA